MVYKKTVTSPDRPISEIWCFSEEEETIASESPLGNEF